MNKPRILFICVHNSARSQMAEAFLNDICGAEFEAQSAGLEPGTLNPLVVEVMRETGLDISKNKTQAVFDVFKSGQLFSYVVTVCSEAEASGCPIFPGPATRLHWPFPDPSKVEGTPDEKLAEIRQIRDAIQARVEQFCAENCTRLTELGRNLRRPQSSDRPR
jgi:arsenate reductase